jgi:restriction endonuclease S subunit
LEAIKVPVPKIDKQRKFENLLNQFNQLNEKREEREKELTQLIPGLLDKAFKGEL